jgi:hypothetical protein
MIVERDKVDERAVLTYLNDSTYKVNGKSKLNNQKDDDGFESKSKK